MTHHENLVTRSGVSEHIAQFFDGDDTRAVCVADFIAHGLAAGARALVVVRSTNWRTINAQLTWRGIDVSSLVARGAITVLDAEDMLETFMDGDRPDRDRFRESVGASVRALATDERVPLRIYGEMVDVLAKMANFVGAGQLEAFWNELASEHPFVLLCGYSSGHFGPERNASALHAICRAHTCVKALSTDPLGAWLTAAADA
jgi:hypothetical protein